MFSWTDENAFPRLHQCRENSIINFFSIFALDLICKHESSTNYTSMRSGRTNLKTRIRHVLCWSRALVQIGTCLRWPPQDLLYYSHQQLECIAIVMKWGLEVFRNRKGYSFCCDTSPVNRILHSHFSIQVKEIRNEHKFVKHFTKKFRRQENGFKNLGFVWIGTEGVIITHLNYKTVYWAKGGSVWKHW